MNLPLKPRAPIEDLIRQGDLEGLLLKAGELHGHFMPSTSVILSDPVRNHVLSDIGQSSPTVWLRLVAPQLALPPMGDIINRSLCLEPLHCCGPVDKNPTEIP